MASGFGVPVLPLWLVAVSVVLIARPGTKDRRAAAPVQPLAEGARMRSVAALCSQPLPLQP